MCDFSVTPYLLTSNQLVRFLITFKIIPTDLNNNIIDIINCKKIKKKVKDTVLLFLVTCYEDVRGMEDHGISVLKLEIRG
jgi:hypothetical protein